MQYCNLHVYCGLVANNFVIWCRGVVQHADGLRVPILSRLWSACAISQAIMKNNLVLYLCYLGCTKLNTKARNELTIQPTAIIVGTDWAAKRNTSAVGDRYI